MIARSICRTGLHPSIGIHHHEKYDNLCLANDLMEPIRPFVDILVKELLIKNENSSMNSHTKEFMKKVITYQCLINENIRDIQNAIPLYVSSFKKVLFKEERKLILPKIIF